MSVETFTGSFAELGDDELRRVARTAAGALLLDDARLYGFISGGPGVDTSRCEEAIAAARERGLAPTLIESTDAAVELAAEWNAVQQEGSCHA
jgi:hypothetical protein